MNFKNKKFYFYPCNMIIFGLYYSKYLAIRLGKLKGKKMQSTAKLERVGFTGQCGTVPVVNIKRNNHWYWFVFNKAKNCWKKVKASEIIGYYVPMPIGTGLRRKVINLWYKYN